MNGYDLIKFFYEEFDTNESMTAECNSAHFALFFRIVEQQNLVGWNKKSFGLPTEVTMRYSGIGNENTFRNKLKDLVQWGTVIIVAESVNQYQSRKVSLDSEKFRQYIRRKQERKIQEEYESGESNLVEAVSRQCQGTVSDTAEAVQKHCQDTALATAETLPSYKTNINLGKQVNGGKQTTIKNKVNGGKGVLNEEELHIQVEYEFYLFGIYNSEQIKRFIEYNRSKNHSLNKNNISEKVKRFVNNMRDDEKNGGQPNHRNHLIRVKLNETDFSETKKTITKKVIEGNKSKEEIVNEINATEWINEENKAMLLNYLEEEWKKQNAEYSDDDPLPF